MLLHFHLGVFGCVCVFLCVYMSVTGSYFNHIKLLSLCPLWHYVIMWKVFLAWNTENFLSKLYISLPSLYVDQKKMYKRRPYWDIFKLSRWEILKDSLKRTYIIGTEKSIQKKSWKESTKTSFSGLKFLYSFIVHDDY